MEPLDLRLVPPRSAHAELDGIAYLPRAIDKIRAEFEGGRLGDYVVLGEDGATVTGGFYHATGITHDELVQVVRTAPNDAAVSDWLHHRLDARTIAKWNEQFRRRTIGDITGSLREKMLLAHPVAAKLPESTPLADMFDADDASTFSLHLRLWSNDFGEVGALPMMQVHDGSGHGGANRSPHLAWDGVPTGTRSFVLTLYDPDAPTGSGLWHWVLVDLPGSMRELDRAVPGEPHRGRHTRNDLGIRAYAGAAPPPGHAHRYVFSIKALSVEKLPVPDDASGALVGYMAGLHCLDSAMLTAYYGVEHGVEDR